MDTETIPILTEDHENNHEYSEDWKFDSTNHWHECYCGEKSDEEEHSFGEGTVTVEPTTTAAGIIEYICTGCGYTKTEAVPALCAHDTTGADWESDGNNHWKECSICHEDVEVEEHTLNSGSVTTPATETEPGVKTYTCTICGYETTEEIPATGGSGTPGDDTPGDDTPAAPGITTVEAPVTGVGAPEVSVGSASVIRQVIELTPEEAAAIAAGADLKITVSVNNTDDTVSDAEKQAVEAALPENFTPGLFFSINMYKQVGNNALSRISSLNSSISITAEVPERLLNTDNTVDREYVVISYHNGKAEILNSSFDPAAGKIKFFADKFPAFVIAYKDTPKVSGDPDAAKTVYSVTVTGDAAVTGDRTAGSVMTVTAPYYMTSRVYSGDTLIATINGSGTFTMPAGNVTVKATDESGAGMMAYNAPNSYIYSYDSQMNLIKTTRSKKGISGTGEITVKLGAKYAGKSVTLYSGKKSTSNKIGEAVLDSKGNATFTVEGAKNYTLVVED